MVAITIAYDQPGVAARIAHHEVGEFVDVGNVTTERVSELISKVLGNPAHCDKARYFQNVIAETNGLEKAADVLQESFQKHQVENLPLEPTGLSFGMMLI
jgi:zeaxanthin glucosyltransferase